MYCSFLFIFFFFSGSATSEIYSLSLHDALPISHETFRLGTKRRPEFSPTHHADCVRRADRKSTRLNSSHSSISYAVFCYKKKSSPPLSLTLSIETNRLA